MAVDMRTVCEKVNVFKALAGAVILVAYIQGETDVKSHGKPHCRGQLVPAFSC